MLNDLFFIDDITELWIKLNQRGLKFILSKFSFIGTARTISSFSDNFPHANWWIIPFIKNRQNSLITGNGQKPYENYITEKYLNNKKDHAKLVSLGCGEGSHEIRLARLNPDLEIIGYDISDALIIKATENARVENLSKTKFIKSDVNKIQFENESIDYFLFNASLHHFKDIKNFIHSKIKPALKKGGFVIINEYVGPNRLNFPKEQIDYCNSCLTNLISLKNKRILGLNKYKTRCYRLGKIRMIISDPSECIDSQSILPVLKSEFTEMECKNLGGNVLMPVLKHIAHHFIEDNKDELMQLVKKEDEYLMNNASDLVFAIYRK